ncbi:GNAT family N-acetyltransferase [Alkalihalobacillus trypoxylicola]|uniref:N-acetyltransferase domain-containing protein n=1 Tax=Alkalihalobacillus trypoxylicola TaxID=519424 RepID=A0A161P5W3_9BACI|nr:GNAT family N-acetyltransferase [Alkalihalobacillus trypoxylicola]KYG25603.1 hypothetical protein AZF04_14040 [Alkalihalobacillus trypoxylicola]
MEIRRLYKEDKLLFEQMNTGIEDDYVLHIYDQLMEEPHFLYGLFEQNQLVSIGGYTMFADEYAMLGRLRSDLSYRGKGYASKLLEFVMNEALKQPEVKWIGGNTQKDNPSAMKVLNKLGLKSYPLIYHATTNDVGSLKRVGELWRKINDFTEKKRWLLENYSDSNNLFGYECYYPFPASEALFSNEKIKEWTIFENESKTRCLLLKNDVKGVPIVHVIYPYDDIWTQPGLWKTIQTFYDAKPIHKESDTQIWLDLSDQQLLSIPAEHTFTISTPWILYGENRQQLLIQQKKQTFL